MASALTVEGDTIRIGRYPLVGRSDHPHVWDDVVCIATMSVADVHGLFIVVRAQLEAEGIGPFADDDDNDDGGEAVPLVSPDEFGARLKAVIARVVEQAGGEPRSPDALPQQTFIGRWMGMPWGRTPLTDVERERLRGVREGVEQEQDEADDAE